jgi:arylsulfatase A-like enzyme
MRIKYRHLLAVTLLSCVCSAVGAAPAGTPPPNLVFILADQWRGSALGFLGREPVLTPSLDKLSRDGLVLTHCVSSYPVCSPYRGMLMSGQFPHQNRVLGNCNTSGARYGYELSASVRCWSDVLKDKAYSLGYIGKWHLDSPHEPYVDTSNNSAKMAWNEWTPPARRHGFDFWYAYGTYDVHLHPEYWTTDAPREQRTKVNQWGPEHEADLAIRYLRNDDGKFRAPDKPFALVLSMNPPHMPYNQVPKKYVERYAGKNAENLLSRSNLDLCYGPSGRKLAQNQIKNYFACMTGVDEQIGRVLEALKAHRLEDNTIVVFTSDHGNCLGAHDEIAKNVAWDESLIVPFLVRWPGHIQPRRDDLLLTPPDIYPTLLDLMGFGPDIPKSVQGTSYASIFRDGTGQRPSSAWYMFVPYGEPGLGRRGVRTQTHTLVCSRDKKEPERCELYDDVTDPWQARNIAAAQPELVEKLKQKELLPWLKKMSDPWLTTGAQASEPAPASPPPKP